MIVIERIITPKPLILLTFQVLTLSYDMICAH